MVWPPNAPSQVQLGRGARDQRVCVLRKTKCRYRAPERFRAGRDRVGATEKAAVVCGEKKLTGVGPPALRAGSGRFGALERAVVLLREEMTQLLYVLGVGQSVTVGVF